jgi:glycosyltransferase involved in cell wall biosynthesis
VVIVDNPVDLIRFDASLANPDAARAQLNLPPRIPLMGVVAQITPWKGQSDAIRALSFARRRHPELALVIAGAAKFVDPGTRYDNRTYARSLEDLAADLGVADAVLFTGEIVDIPALMAALDIVLVPSWEEPFGRVVIEGMAMHRAVIATDVGGPADIITDGVDGILLPPRSPDIWGARITKLLDQPQEMVRLGDAARAATTRYDLPSFTRLVVGSYESALSAPTIP